MKKRKMWTLVNEDGSLAIENVSSGFDEKKKHFDHEELPLLFGLLDANNARRYLSDARGEDLRVVEVELTIVEPKKTPKKRSRR